MDRSVYQMYVLYDRIAEECSNIYYARNNSHIVRLLRDIKSDPLNNDDLELYCVGSIDITSMVIDPVTKPVLVQPALDKE